MSISCVQAGKRLSALSQGSLTHLKMQIILYFAHMHHLGKHDKKLIKNKFLAGELGPVALELYEHINDYGGDPVPNTAFDDISKLNEDEHKSEHESLKSVYSKFRGFSLNHLVSLSSNENGAWGKARRLGILDLYNEDIKDEYSEVFKVR